MKSHNMSLGCILYIYIYIYTYIYIYIYMYVYMYIYIYKTIWYCIKSNDEVTKNMNYGGPG